MSITQKNTSENSLSTPLLSAKKLTCIRESRILFEALNLEVYAGDIIQIEGPNGAGKTSLLRILSGLSRPYEGNVFFRTNNINTSREDFNQNLLYLGHLPGVKGEMTAQENLAFNLSMQGINPEVSEATLNEVNLLGFEDTLASHLSAGQHRRIALAQLWQTKTPIWILDEPFTAIDKQGVKTLESLFLKHVSNGGCVILTTHQDLSLPESTVKKITLQYSYY